MVAACYVCASTRPCKSCLTEGLNPAAWDALGCTFGQSLLHLLCKLALMFLNFTSVFSLHWGTFLTGMGAVSKGLHLICWWGQGKFFPLKSSRCPLCKMFRKSHCTGKSRWRGRCSKLEWKGTLKNWLYIPFHGFIFFLKRQRLCSGMLKPVWEAIIECLPPFPQLGVDKTRQTLCLASFCSPLLRRLLRGLCFEVERGEVVEGCLPLFLCLWHTCSADTHEQLWYPSLSSSWGSAPRSHHGACCWPLNC